MPDLRVRASQEAKDLNIKEFGLLVEFISPDGIIYNTDYETGDPLKAVMVLYDKVSMSPTTGDDMIIPEPIVVMSRLSLERIPLDSEKWIVRIQESPITTTMIDYMLSETKASEGGKSLDLIRFNLQELEQV